LCDEGAKLASKRLKVNDIGVHSDSSSRGILSTLGITSTPITLGTEDILTEEGGGLLRAIGRKATKRKS